MKLYKNIKRSRLPKEVFILIDILNNHSSDRYHSYIASMGINLFYIKNYVIKPYHYNFDYFFTLVGIPRKQQHRHLKACIELAIQNSKYSEYEIVNL